MMVCGGGTGTEKFQCVHLLSKYLLSTFRAQALI